jgi:hypothetical protein
MSAPIVLSREEALHLYEAVRFGAHLSPVRAHPSPHVAPPLRSEINGVPILEWATHLLARRLYGTKRSSSDLDDDSGLGWATGEEDLENYSPAQYDPTI